MSSNYPDNVSNRDPAAPWNQPAYDGADTAHGIEVVTGGDTVHTVETFHAFAAGFTDEPKKLLAVSDFWIRANASDTDLQKILLTSENKTVCFAALTELRARYLADPYTQRVIESAAAEWRAEQAEVSA